MPDCNRLIQWFVRNPNGTEISRILVRLREHLLLRPLLTGTLGQAAEVGSLSMELTRLSQITGDMAYYNTALRIQERLSHFHGEYGTLVSHFLGPDGSHGGDFTLGGMIDRYVA